ncbi:MAG TPA: LysR family transcriptional regulator [Bauldia sp.]|nr:LysR family transcriptional regulator [Bauldia sp.]
MLVIVLMHDVHEDSLRGLDLNLLIVLKALIAEKSVTRAAALLGLSQPAASHALARLRKALGDRLLVRTPQGMEPTPRARAIAEPLERALADLARAINRPGPFDPARARRRFRIATDDYHEIVLLPRLLARLWHEAPGIDIRVTPVSDRSGRDLAEGRIDLIIDPVTVLGPLPGAYAQRILDERFVCAVREGHPAVGKKLTLEVLVKLPHVLVAPAGRPGGVVDAALTKLGLRRRVAVEIPHFLAVPAIVREIDAVATMPERIARAFGAGLRILAPPIDLPSFTIETVWHERHHGDPAHAWFRGLVAEVARSL